MILDDGLRWSGRCWQANTFDRFWLQFNQREETTIKMMKSCCFHGDENTHTHTHQTHNERLKVSPQQHKPWHHELPLHTRKQHPPITRVNCVYRATAAPAYDPAAPVKTQRWAENTNTLMQHNIRCLRRRSPLMVSDLILLSGSRIHGKLLQTQVIYPRWLFSKSYCLREGGAAAERSSLTFDLAAGRAPPEDPDGFTRSPIWWTFPEITDLWTAAEPDQNKSCTSF